MVRLNKFVPSGAVLPGLGEAPFTNRRPECFLLKFRSRISPFHQTAWLFILKFSIPASKHSRESCPQVERVGRDAIELCLRQFFPNSLQSFPKLVRLRSFGSHLPIFGASVGSQRNLQTPARGRDRRPVRG